MKILFSCLLVLNGFTAIAQDNLNSLEQFVGVWKASDSHNYEVWEKVNDSLYTGSSYELIKDKKELKEIIVLEKKDNAIIYSATVFHQNDGKPVSFTLMTNLPDTFSFENETHDFPNKIQYHFLKKNALEIRVSGLNGKSFVLNLEKE